MSRYSEIIAGEGSASSPTTSNWRASALPPASVPLTRSPQSLAPAGGRVGYYRAAAVLPRSGSLPPVLLTLRSGTGGDHSRALRVHAPWRMAKRHQTWVARERQPVAGYGAGTSETDQMTFRCSRFRSAPYPLLVVAVKTFRRLPTPAPGPDPAAVSASRTPPNDPRRSGGSRNGAWRSQFGADQYLAIRRHLS